MRMRTWYLMKMLQMMTIHLYRLHQRLRRKAMDLMDLVLPILSTRTMTMRWIKVSRMRLSRKTQMRMPTWSPMKMLQMTTTHSCRCHQGPRRREMGLTVSELLTHSTRMMTMRLIKVSPMRQNRRTQTRMPTWYPTKMLRMMMIHLCRFHQGPREKVMGLMDLVHQTLSTRMMTMR